MTGRKRLAVALVAALLMLPVLGGVAAAAPNAELVGEATSQAFTLRASADQGGASPLHFYFGSYADAYLTTPPPEADGQASWYNFGIAETALFKPPEECTPEKNAERVQEGLAFVADWLTNQITNGEAVQTILGGNIPAPPAPTLPCGGGRFPGFAQSRYPATSSIGPSAEDDLLASGACRGEAACIEAVEAATAGLIEGGSFRAEATDAPSQSSDAIVVGLQIPDVLRIDGAQSKASTTLGRDGLITSVSRWALSGLCLLPSKDGCALAIEQVVKTATVIRAPGGKVIKREAKTLVAGVHGSGQAQDIDAGDLQSGLPAVDVGDFPGCVGCVLQLQPVVATGGCGDPSSDFVADAGGLRLFARGNGEVTLPVPIIGNAAGGGLMLGGACAAGRIASVDLGGSDDGDDGGNGAGPGIGVPPGGPVIGVPPSVTGPVLSPPRVLSKDVVRYVLRSAPAWRTAPYWASVLVAMLLLGILGYVFREKPLVVPVARRVDRFARQFIRG